MIGMLLIFHSYLQSDVSCRESMLIDQTQFLKSEMRKLDRSRYTLCSLFEKNSVACFVYAFAILYLFV